MKSRVGALLAIVGVVLLMAGTANAVPAHYTDGSTFQGETNFGPPPLPPAFSTACETAIVDPPTFVFVTLHFVYGTTAPTAGAVPVHDDAADVVPYVGGAPGTFLVDVSAFVAGKVGFLAYTWNIGTGVTTWLPFDCTPPASSTTTSIANEGTTVQSSTTTSIAPLGSTSTSFDPSTTSIATSPTGEQLPFTGGDTEPLVFVAVLLLATGGVMVARARMHR
jgi:hypothetical protein